MNVSSQDKLSEKWPWNGEFLRLMLLLPSVMGIAASVALFPFAGFHALWFLTAILVGAVLYLTFGGAGRRVENLKRELQNEPGDMAEGLLVIGKVHSPGIAVLRESELVLAPIVGERRVFPLETIDVIGEGRWLPGKYVWGKRAFTLNASSMKPLAFAVPESVGARWSPILRNRRDQ